MNHAMMRNNMNNTPNNHIVAITGGIGSGKSVVSKIIRAMGYEVYDCDTQAKKLMDNSQDILQAIKEYVSADAINNNRIDRKVLGEIVFSNPDKLKELNRIVHSAVKDDFEKWVLTHRPAFVETAILYTSGMDDAVTEVWTVTAPESLRVKRIQQRNPELSLAQILNRIESQKAELNPIKQHRNSQIVVNDDCEPLLPQLERLIKDLL